MKTISRIILVGLLVSFSVGCKKYPESNSINLNTREARMKNNWEPEYFTIDNVDSTAILKSQVFFGNYDLSKPNGNNEFVFRPQDQQTFFPDYSGKGTWQFEQDKKYVSFHFDDLGTSSASYGPFRVNGVSWEIRRLTTLQLWLQTTYQNKQYYLRFKRV